MELNYNDGKHRVLYKNFKCTVNGTSLCDCMQNSGFEVVDKCVEIYHKEIIGCSIVHNRKKLWDNGRRKKEGVVCSEQHKIMFISKK